MSSVFLSLFFNVTILAVNFLVPLLVIPIIGKYYDFIYLNEYLFFQSSLAFLSIISDWGFSTTGIKELSVKFNEKDRIKCFFEILVFRFLAFIVSFTSLILLLYIFRVESNFLFGVFILLSGLSFAISPIFYLQYQNKMKFYSMWNFISKLIFILGTYLIGLYECDFSYIGILFFVCYFIVPFMFVFILCRANINIIAKIKLVDVLSIGRNYVGFLIASIC